MGQPKDRRRTEDSDEPSVSQGFAVFFQRTYPDLVGARILVALSGGADSVALLHLLMHRNLRLHLSACHVHHGVRGKAADADAHRCRQLCNEHSIPFALHRITVADRHHEGREAAWRRARYEALDAAADELDASVIATAHHRDDIAEGVLTQILRGTGTRALAGISLRSQRLIRPLLPWSRETLRTWLARHEISWSEDHSNLDPIHLRNHVRHEVLPLLEARSPQIRRHLCRLASSLANDEAYFAQQLSTRAEWIEVYDPEGGVPLTMLTSLPNSLRVRWLHAQVARAGIGKVTHRQCALFQSLLDGVQRSVTLANRWVLRRAAGKLWLEPPTRIPPYNAALEAGDVLDLPLPGWQVRCRRNDSLSTVASRWRYTLAEAHSLTIRSASSEDRLEDGRRVRKVLKKHLPRHLRCAWPILVRDDKILWIPGFGVENDHGSVTWTVEVMRT